MCWSRSRSLGPPGRGSARRGAAFGFEEQLRKGWAPLWLYRTGGTQGPSAHAPFCNQRRILPRQVCRAYIVWPSPRSSNFTILAFRSSHERVPDGLPCPAQRYSAIAVAEVSERSLMKRGVLFTQRTFKSKILQCTGSPQGRSVTTVPPSIMARVWKTCWGLWDKVAADTGLKPSPARRDVHLIGVLGTTSAPRGPPSSASPKGSGRST